MNAQTATLMARQYVEVEAETPFEAAIRLTTEAHEKAMAAARAVHEHNMRFPGEEPHELYAALQKATEAWDQCGVNAAMLANGRREIVMVIQNSPKPGRADEAARARDCGQLTLNTKAHSAAMLKISQILWNIK